MAVEGCSKRRWLRVIYGRLLCFLVVEVKHCVVDLRSAASVRVHLLFHRVQYVLQWLPRTILQGLHNRGFFITCLQVWLMILQLPTDSSRLRKLVQHDVLV